VRERERESTHVMAAFDYVDAFGLACIPMVVHMLACVHMHEHA